MSSHSPSGGRSSDEDGYFSRADPVSLRVVEAVAAFRDADPLELEPLAEYVDADALNDLFSPVGEGGVAGASVSFRYEGVRVTVTGDGDIDVRDAGGAERRE